MAVVKPFRAIRPAKENAAAVAALPYDVYNREEACKEVAGKPLSFLNILFLLQNQRPPITQKQGLSE